MQRKSNTTGSGAQPDRGALDGLKVVDFSRMLPGPWCTQMLADLGCEVIKIEQPGIGDLGRYNPPAFKKDSVYFSTVNLNKRSVELDLGQKKDLDIAHELMSHADVVVESFRTGVPRRLGIDYETARRLKGDVIYCSVTGFGQDGPFAQIPGHDLVVQSMTGIMSVMHDAQNKPLMPPFQAADYAAATYAVMGILAALYRRRDTGEGCYLDVAMFDSLLSMSNVISGGALARAAGSTETAAMELWGKNPRYDTYSTRDGGAVAVSLLETRIWNAFCTLIERTDLINEHEGPSDRHTVHGTRSALYRDAIVAFCASKDRDPLVAWARDNDVPILPVYTCDEAISSPHAKARNLVEWVDHPAEGRIPVLSNPLARSGLTRQQRTAAPALGANNGLVEGPANAKIGRVRGEKA